MRVNVTKDHIRRGKAGDPASCPVALAIKDTFKAEFKKSKVLADILGRKVSVEVDSDVIDVNNLSTESPKKVARFVEKFDLQNEEEREVTVKPFSFDLRMKAKGKEDSE